MTTLLAAAVVLLCVWFVKRALTIEPPKTLAAFHCECGTPLRGVSPFCPKCGAASAYNPALAVSYDFRDGQPVRTGGMLYVNGHRVELDGNLRRIADRMTLDEFKTGLEEAHRRDAEWIHTHGH